MKSSLTNVTISAYSGNYTKGRSQKISKITIHHMAGVMTAEQCGYIWQKKGRNGSSHYGIGNDGRIGNYVDESNTAWTDSNWNSNCKSVTIETSNSKTGGNWPVSDKALNSLIKLVADIAKRNGLGKLVKGQNLTWHSMYASTTCPGDYLRSKMDYIVSEANKINGYGVQNISNNTNNSSSQKSGSNREKSLQTALNKCGAKLSVDGSYGSLTTKAVSKYWNYKEVIKWVQQVLKELGYYKGSIDGLRGPLTKDATRRYQKDNGLTQDKIAGPNTIKSLSKK